MKRFKNILVATDTRLDGHPIVEEAAKLARDNRALLKIVDSVPEFSWTVRLTLRDHSRLTDLMKREKREKLEALAAPIRDMGTRVETKVLLGKTSVEIIREVLRDKHDLVLRVARGRESPSRGYFGTTGIRLLRDCPCAVWLVMPVATREYKHLLGCVDTSSGDKLDAELNDKIYDLASWVSRHHGARLSVVHIWSVFGEQLLRNRMSTRDLEEMMRDNRDQAEALLDQFLVTHGSGVREPDVHMIKGDPSSVIPAFARENEVDLVVMGTVARSGSLGMIIGNTAERILGGITCPVLGVNPDSFVCPIKLGEYIHPERVEHG